MVHLLCFLLLFSHELVAIASATEKHEESIRVKAQFEQKKKEQQEEINKKVQEAKQWRFHRQLQLAEEEEIAIDEAHHASILREERDRKMKQKEAEKREAMQMQRLAFAHKHKQKLARIAKEAREKEAAMGRIALETEAKMQAADRIRCVLRPLLPPLLPL